MPPEPSILVGESPAIRHLRALITTVAPTRLPVLIEGETGSGKELVALMLHRLSGRDGALVSFNVCALGESMFEDALFGHARGAYTGALSESLGFLREANGGTAFLDEITGLPLPLQAKLLRAIETGVFRPIGAARDARSDFRPIAATNERLDLLVQHGRFRADLAHRLSGVVLAVPSLDERRDDIPLLVAHFVHGNGARERQRPITPGAIRLLQNRPWPGNVRELKQVVDAALVFAGESFDEYAIEIATAHRSRPAGPIEHPGLADRHELVALLERSSWDIDAAATSLGIHRATLYRRIKRLHVAIPHARVAPARSASRDTFATRATENP